MRTSPFSGAPLLALAIGCTEPEPEPFDPCDLDPLACGEGEAFELDPACHLTGDLDLELGEGENTFLVLPAGTVPNVESGPEGGPYVFLGARVNNPAEAFPLLRVSFWAERAYGCEQDEDPNCVPMWQEFGSRTVAADETLIEVDSGTFETFGFVVLLDDWEFAAPGRIRLRVEDPCDRRGDRVHEFDGG